jgi:hypothetical protein
MRGHHGHHSRTHAAAGGCRQAHYDIQRQRQPLKVEACSVVGQAASPQCAWSSTRVHGRCRRWIADCPYFDQSLTLEIEVRRFKCVNGQCPQRTFCERIDVLAAPSGSLLKPKVKINPMAGVQGAEQRGELGRRGRAGKGGPAARQPVGRGQPGAHRAQQARPARQRLGAAGFFPPPRVALSAC